MEKFWAVILIFVVVAAAGLMYVNQVYNPQRDTQETMAKMAQTTLTAVKQEIGDIDEELVVLGSELLVEIGKFVNDDDTVHITGVKTHDGRFADFRPETAIVSSSTYKVEIVKKPGQTTKINITLAS